MCRQPMTRINRHFDHVIDVNMILTVENYGRRSRQTYTFQARTFCRTEDADMYVAIDLLDRQIGPPNHQA